MKAPILASGNLGLNCLKSLQGIDVCCVFTDSNSSGIIEYCERNQVPIFKGNPRNGATKRFRESFQPDILFSINYLFVIEKDLIEWPLLYAFNIHGSLLPKYRGRTPHVWAIINGEKEAGLTIHLIDEGCDTGNIVLQKVVRITEDMTGADVLKEYEKLYPLAIQEVIELAKQHAIVSVPQQESSATYFGIRRPEDGHIDWARDSERIRNWIRAQAAPYPGAFFFYKSQKVTVNKAIVISSNKETEMMPGTIHAVDGKTLTVHTADGLIQLTSLVPGENLIFTVGEILS